MGTESERYSKAWTSRRTLDRLRWRTAVGPGGVVTLGILLGGPGVLGGCVDPAVAAVAPNSTEAASFDPPTVESCIARLQATEEPLRSDEFVLQVQDQTHEALRRERLLVGLDGTRVFREDRPEALRQGPRVIFRRRLALGEHTLQLFSKLSGSGRGRFSYLRAYKFDVKSSHRFQIVEGRGLCLTVHFYLRPASLPLEERPALGHVEQYSPAAERE